MGRVYLHAAGPDGLAGSHARPARRARAGAGARDRHGAPSPACASDGKSRRSRMTPAASVSGDERLRLFLALRLPDDVLDEIERWQRAQLTRRSRRPARAPARHARVPRPPAGGRARSDRRGVARGGSRGGGDPAHAGSLPRDAERRHARPRGRRRAGGSARRGRPGAAGAPRRLPSRRPALAAAPHGRALARAARGSGSNRRRYERSFRPTRLLTYPGCTPTGRGTKSWNLSL